jgi:hypothetical protein
MGLLITRSFPYSLIQNPIALVVLLAGPLPTPITDQDPILKLVKQPHQRPPRLVFRREREEDFRPLRLPCWLGDSRLPVTDERPCSQASAMLGC